MMMVKNEENRIVLDFDFGDGENPNRKQKRKKIIVIRYVKIIEWLTIALLIINADDDNVDDDDDMKIENTTC